MFGDWHLVAKKDAKSVLVGKRFHAIYTAKRSGFWIGERNFDVSLLCEVVDLPRNIGPGLYTVSARCLSLEAVNCIACIAAGVP